MEASISTSPSELWWHSGFALLDPFGHGDAHRVARWPPDGVASVCCHGTPRTGGVEWISGLLTHACSWWAARVAWAAPPPRHLRERVHAWRCSPGPARPSMTRSRRCAPQGSPESVPLAADLTNLSEVDSAIDRLGERWEALEVLVNTAGPVDVGIGPFDRLDDDQWRATFDIGRAQRGSHGSPYPAPAPSRVVRQDRQRLGPLHQAAESGPRGVYRNQSCPE